MTQTESEELETPVYHTNVIWSKAFKMLFLHACMIYGMYITFTEGPLKTFAFNLLVGQLSCLGITAGNHRLWAHRAYKAKLPLRIFLSVCSIIGAQGSIFKWARDHRVHHKYTETVADPHNIKRGFFFAHVGWLMCEKTPECIAKGENLDLKDLYNDPVVRFNKNFYFPLLFLINFFLPTMIPIWVWGESFRVAYFITMFRYGLQLNSTWLVNSAAHTYGMRPFDKREEARENIPVTYITLGEGWHNYHHTFPGDYAASELGTNFNPSKSFIDLMAWIGQAYDLKTPNPEKIKSWVEKYGDGTKVYEEKKGA